MTGDKEVGEGWEKFTSDDAFAHPLIRSCIRTFMHALIIQDEFMPLLGSKYENGLKLNQIRLNEHEIKWYVTTCMNDMTWDDMTCNGAAWPEIQWYGRIWNQIKMKLNEIGWYETREWMNEMAWHEMKVHESTWKGMTTNWSEMEWRAKWWHEVGFNENRITWKWKEWMDEWMNGNAIWWK